MDYKDPGRAKPLDPQALLYEQFHGTRPLITLIPLLIRMASLFMGWSTLSRRLPVAEPFFRKLAQTGIISNLVKDASILNSHLSHLMNFH